MKSFVSDDFEIAWNKELSWPVVRCFVSLAPICVAFAWKTGEIIGRTVYYLNIHDRDRFFLNRKKDQCRNDIGRAVIHLLAIGILAYCLKPAILEYMQNLGEQEKVFYREWKNSFVIARKLKDIPFAKMRGNPDY